MIDESFCNQVGSIKQHRYACALASSLGYSSLRYAVSDALGISVSKCAKKIVTIKDASTVIDFLRKKKGE